MYTSQPFSKIYIIHCRQAAVSGRSYRPFERLPCLGYPRLNMCKWIWKMRKIIFKTLHNYGKMKSRKCTWFLHFPNSRQVLVDFKMYMFLIDWLIAEMTNVVIMSHVWLSESKAKRLFPLADIWVKWGGGNGWDHSEGATQQLICIASIKVQLPD